MRLASLLPCPPVALSRGALFALLLASSGVSPVRAAEPRPLSEAERQGVLVAIDYLDRGPVAIVERLSPTSPFREIPADRLADEIEARLGPSTATRWSLVTTSAENARSGALFAVRPPGGLEEGVLFRFDPNGWKLKEVRCLAERESVTVRSTEEDEVLEKARAMAEARRREQGLLEAGGAGGLLLLALVLSGASLRRNREGRRSRARLVAGLAFGAGAAWVGFRAYGRLRPLPPPPSPASKVTRLAGLLPLRRALAAGEREAAKKLFSTTNDGNEVRHTWEALESARRGDVAHARQSLAHFPDPSGIPLAEVARAELAYAERDETACARGWDKFVSTGIEHDLLMIDAAAMLAPIGYEDRVTWLLDRALSNGSRSAGAWYGTATSRVLRTWQGEIDAEKENISPPDADSEKFFATGWKLHPLDRDTLFSDALLWYYLAGSASWPAFHFESPNEPVVPPSAAPTRSLVLPSGATARTCGESLRIRVKESQLAIDGGADLAPASTPAEDAGAAIREDEEAALARLPELVSAPPVADAWSDPALRRRLATTAEALARRHRWEELAAVTRGMPANPAGLPVELVRLRAYALHRLERTAEERALLLAYASSEVDLRHRDPGILMQLSDAFVAEKQYDVATKLMKKALGQIPFGADESRLRAIAVQKKLDEAFVVQESAHFSVRAPKSADPRATARLLEVLEAERGRLGRIIPLTEKKHPVDVLDAVDFFAGFSVGNAETVGLFDGRIRLPLAGMRRFAPELVAILTHELAHSLMAEATRSRAPKWFQEGVAQQLEMHEWVNNPMRGYAEKKRLLSLLVAEGALERFPQSEVVTAAYDTSAWTIRYIDAHGGSSALQALMAAFRDGATTEEAIRKLYGKNMERFDADLQAWWTGPAPKEIATTPVRYEDLGPRGITMGASR